MRVLVFIVSLLMGLGVVAPAHASTSSRTRVSTVGTVVSQAPPSSTTQEAGPLPAVVATEIHWTRWSRRVVYGRSSTLEGQVVTADGAVPGAAVDLYARPAGSRGWSRIGSTTSSPDTGVFRFNSHEPSATTDYRVVFERTLVYERSEADKRVRVARRVRDSMTRIDSDSFRFKGSVAPEYDNRRVVLQRKKCSSCAWSKVATKRTTRRSRWSFRVNGPARRRTHYYRALVPADGKFVNSYSDHTWALSVR